MFFALNSTQHFEKFHTPKINKLHSAKLEVNLANLEYTSTSKKKNAIAIKSLANTTTSFNELIQDKHWFSFCNITSKQQQKDIDTVLKQLSLFEKLIVNQEYSSSSEQKHTTFFHSLQSNIDSLQTDIQKRYLQHQNLLHYTRIFIILSLLSFIFGVLFIATKRKKIRENILKKAKLTNSFLQESHHISKLIAYSYDFKTKYWESSGSFKDLIGTEVDVYSMQFWIERIHPEDKEKITNLFNLRLHDSSTKFNEAYRIINATTGKTHWIQHEIQGLKRDGKGNLLPEHGVIQDITKFKLANEKIKRADAILNKINSIVLVINSEGSVTYASEGIKNILGYEPKDVLDLGWWKLSYPDAESAQKTKDANYNHFFNQDSFVTDNEFSLRKIKTKKGDYKWIKWSFTKENESSFIAIGVDVTRFHEKTKRYVALTETAHDAIVVANDKGEIIDINETAVRMFGYPKVEFLDKPLSALIPEKHVPSFVQEFSNANKKEYYTKSETRIGGGLTKDGVIFPVEVSFNSWLDDDGNKTHCAFIKDITQQKYEEKIKEVIFDLTKFAQEKPTLDALLPFIKKNLSPVIDTSTLFISLYDDDKQVFDSYENINAKNGKAVVNFPKGESLFDHVMTTKESLLYTEPSKINGSQIKSKCWVGVPLITKQKVIGIISIRSYTDKSAYSQKDVSLLELVASTLSQIIQQIKDFERINLLNQALVQSSAIIIITDLKGNIEYVNPSFTKITGYESDEVLGKNPSVIGLSKINKPVSTKLWKTITKGKPWEGEFTNIKKDGNHYTVYTSIAPVKNNAKEITHYISVQEDITKKRKLENEFVNGFVEAQEIEKRAFGEELHDGISQILSAETLYINVLIKENQDRIHDKAKFLTKIKELNLKASNEARNIAHGLMSNQLLENGLIKSIENICIDYTNTKNIKFYFFSNKVNEDELPKKVKINIFRVIQEITTNIVRHSKATKATITLTKLKQNTLNLIIKDNGVGIDSGNKTKKHSEGIGFENIKRRITLLNGTIDIDTSLNNGLCYTINIPM